MGEKETQRQGGAEGARDVPAESITEPDIDLQHDDRVAGGAGGAPPATRRRHDAAMSSIQNTR